MEYYVITTSSVAAISAQLLKLAPKIISGEKLSAKVIFSYGSLPSSHAAFVTALTTSIGIKEGINSSVFAIALVFAVIVLRDAIGLRMIVEKNSKQINKLNKQVNGDINNQALDESVGHTIVEVAAGCLVGFMTSVIIHLII